MEKLYDLTNPQKSIWYTEQFYKKTSIENISGRITISKPVDFKKLEKAINILVQKNDSFRLQFMLDGNDIKQYLVDFKSFKIETFKVNSEDDVKQLEQESVSTPFNPFDSLLFNFKFFEYPDGHGGFIVTIHHLICDAWSAGLCSDKIIEIYSCLCKNKEYNADNVPSYMDYIASEQEYFKSKKFETDKAYWEEVFSNVPEVATIPSNMPTSSKISSESKRKTIPISAETMDLINKFCKEFKISLFNFFMGIFSIYISKVSSLEEFVIGTPILNRSNVKDKNTSGIFINVMPLKISINNEISFSDFASQIAKNTFSAFKHQKYSYQSILSDLRKKNSSIPNLFSILMSYQNMRSKVKSSDITYNIDWVFNNNISDDIDIHFFDINNTGKISIAYDYKTQKYSLNDILDIHSRILNIINQVLTVPNILLKDINIVTPDEKEELLYKFNDTKVDYPKDKTISQLFEEQVEKTPDNIALVFENKQLTYKELNEKANSLAHYLRNKGVGRNNIIGIMVNRSLEMIISILAVLKAGGTYIPIDPEYPKERVEYMLSNSKAKFLLTFEKLKDDVSFENMIFVDLNSSKIYDLSKNNLPNINKVDDLTYVIYTSGSTGLPKGVMLKNINIVNFIYAMYEKFNFDSSNTIVSITTISFDIFVLESLLPLLKGMKIVIASENAQTNVKLFNELCATHKIDIVQTTPTRIQAFLLDKTNSFINRIKYLLIGGEPFPENLLEELHSTYKGKIYNMYGPTETAVWSSMKDLTSTNNITIGVPIGNTQIYILDQNHTPLPIGISGEIYIAGDGVSKGYLNNPELTQKSFIPNPFVPNTLMYKTGDIGYFRPDGEIVCLGRNDSQVKIRGLRIELGEIESCISTYPNIDKCVVVVNSEQQLVAFYSALNTININDIKSFLQRKLPSYFIPTFFVKLDKFPLTPNGKIDKKVLRAKKFKTETNYEAPNTEYQKKLVKIFENVLKQDKIGINDNFFELGGDSLLAIQLQIEAFNQGLDLSYKHIFNYPTIKQLSSNIHESEKTFLEEENYDYSEINKLIVKNKINNNLIITKEKIKNILLTGSTGYTGSHVLDYLLKHTKCNIYCLIRAKNNTDPQTRLLDVLHFYFGNKYDKYIFKRIFAVEGNIVKKNLGLNAVYYNKLGTSIDCIINCAAIVKHYGNSSIFNEINVSGVQNLIDFCLKFNCKLMHLSTLSVSGNIFETDTYQITPNSESTIFTEQNLYIGQDLSNIYVHTKFIAEKLILENIIKNNLNAKILRLGNITNRYSDGSFQINVSENAFLNRLNSFLQIGYMPDYLLEQDIEFTPVDLCAEAIVKLTMYKNPYTIFHVYNNNDIKFKDLQRILTSLNIKMDIVSTEIFNKRVKNLSNNEDTKNTISGIIRDFDRNNKLQYHTNIKIKNNFTNKFLKNLLFRWPKINEKYLKKYINYLKSIKYI